MQNFLNKLGTQFIIQPDMSINDIIKDYIQQNLINTAIAENKQCCEHLVKIKHLETQFLNLMRLFDEKSNENNVLINEIKRLKENENNLSKIINELNNKLVCISSSSSQLSNQNEKKRVYIHIYIYIYIKI